jgi:carbohydrate-selective porin OprB
MEVFYNLALTPWLQFSPSVQYIDSGQVDVDHSVVVMTRLPLYF